MVSNIPYHEWKKPVALLLGVIFLFSSLGLTLYAHNCPFKGSSISFSPEKKCCCSSDSKTSDNCCKNKAHQIKIKGKYCPAKGLEIKAVDFTVFSVQLILFDSLQVGLVQKQSFHYSDPSPPSTDVPIFILDRSILI